MFRVEKKDLKQVARGFLMGGADIIPGVSGGTVALILGIYQRLVGAISHCDAHLLKLLSQRKWPEAVEYFDFRFLVTLGIGILTGVACLANLMHELLLHQRSYTLAVFFGLILASSLIVMRMVRPANLNCYVLTILAAIFAFWLVGLEQIGFQDNLGYFFFSGMIAICAMILPGISGSYILWLLGGYVAVTGIIKDVLKLQGTSRDLLCFIVFAAGCAVGLIGFSKLLKWLLARYQMPIMALLGGFMIGSLRLMWPFQIDLTPEVEKLKLKRYEQIMPEAWNSEAAMCLVLAIVAVLAVLALERWGSVDEDSVD